MNNSKNANSKLLHIAAGFLLGILVLSVLFYISSVLNRSKNETTKISSTSGFNLSLTDAPADGASTSQGTVTIAGTTGTQAVVVVNGGSDDATVQTSGGKFNLTYTLSEGENQITVTAFDQNTGEAKTSTRNVLYLPNLDNL